MNDDSIKLMSLLEELEDLIVSSSKMPFSEKGIIDLDVAQKIIEDIRANLPRDIQQARWLDQERDRIISDAKKEYNRMINEAKEQVEYLVNNNNIYKDAQYIDPMTEYFNQMLGNINARVNQNRQEMKTLAERVQLGEQPEAEAPAPAEEAEGEEF